MKKLVVFSHGFGVDKTDRGLFSDIASALGDQIVPVMFDYNEIAASAKTMRVRPLSRQAEILKESISEAKNQNPELPVCLIAHSQGCLVAAMAQPDVQKVIFTAAAVNFDIERLVKNFSDRPGTKIDLDGTSRLNRRDGSVTIIGPEYIKELQSIQPVPLYQELAAKTKLILIRADQDEVVGEVSYEGIDAVKVIGLAADHNFTGLARQQLIGVIKEELWAAN